MKSSWSVRSLMLSGLLLLAHPIKAVAIEPSEVIDTYANIAQASYQDALQSARNLRVSIRAFIEEPSEQSLQDARDAWKSARIPFQQTEVFRFGNAIVDDWEGKVNAWPLDEGLIDYVDDRYGTDSELNELYAANIIANPSVNFNGQAIDATVITAGVLSTHLHKAGGIESNVAIGYHAIEFLLWGQDLNGSKAGAGARPFTDYAVNNCTNGHCERRAQYLSAVTNLLITDLEYMASAWANGGEARTGLKAADGKSGLAAMLTGMGSLGYGELAGERMQLVLMLHNPEEEYEGFSDNTSASHFYGAIGIQNVYRGSYKRVDGSVVSGPSFRDLLASADKSLAAELDQDLQMSINALQVLLDLQGDGQAYDQLIAEGNIAGNQVVRMAVDSLISQTRTIERVSVALGLSGIHVKGADSLDDPSSVFQ